MRPRLVVACVVWLTACLWNAPSRCDDSIDATVGPAPAAPAFETDVRAVFREYCFDCHGATEEVQGGLDLRLVRFLLRGGDSGPAIVAGDADASYLIQRLEDGEMPPGEVRVPESQVALLRAWITQGAHTLRPEPQQLGPGIPISEEERSHWAYQPIVKPAVSLDRTDPQVRTPIDQLLRDAMPDGLSFSPDADRHTLIVRVYLDLLGLPPTPDELEHWMQAPGPRWYEALVDAVLESPHYGERWARHWLDVAGYADSEGATEKDAERPWAWKYRDYVIRAFNDDKPFDQFIIEQLAGDELAGPRHGDWTAEQIELLTATGFLRMAADGTGSGDNSPEARNQTIADTLRIVGSALLASSVHCAQCHDHRYDPISHTDYFALRAVFEPALDWQQWQTPAQRLVSLYTQEDQQRAKQVEAEAQTLVNERQEKQREYMAQALEKELMKYDEPLRELLRKAYQTSEKDRTPEQQELLKKHPSVNITPGVLYQYLPAAAEELKKYDQRIAEVRAQKPREEFVRSLAEPPGHVPVTHLFHRGDHRQPKQAVVPAALTVATPENARIEFPLDDVSLPTTGRRLAFAQWLTSRDNPLLARAIVNRVWMHHFGRGIVATPSEFGKLGAPPTHPKLLDWLAADFVDSGWSLRRLHRQILLSTAWRQSSYADPVRQAMDPENRYYWRKSLQRLDAEVIRDRMLVVSGRLDRSLFGPPVPLKKDDTGQVVVGDGPARRTLYVQSRRTEPVALLQTFDAPVMEVNCERRPVSTVATQSLMLLNGQFTLDQARRIAERICNDAGHPDADHPAARMESWATQAWRKIYLRDPTEAERELVQAFAAQQRQQLAAPPAADTDGSASATDATEKDAQAQGAASEQGMAPDQQVLINLCQMLLNSNEFLYAD